MRYQQDILHIKLGNERLGAKRQRELLTFPVIIAGILITRECKPSQNGRRDVVVIIARQLLLIIAFAVEDNALLGAMTSANKNQCEELNSLRQVPNLLVEIKCFMPRFSIRCVTSSYGSLFGCFVGRKNTTGAHLRHRFGIVWLD